MKRLTLASLSILVCLYSTSISIQTDIDRTPSSKHETSKLGKMYQYKGWLAIPPVRFVASIIVKKKISKYLETLPLETEVKDRIVKQIHSDVFSHQIAPFVLALKELYSIDDSIPHMDFNKHIVSAFPDKESVPGLEHDLFSYEKRVKEKKASLLKGNEAIAMILSFYDAIIVQDKNFKLGTFPEITNETRARVRQLSLKALDQKLQEIDEDEGAHDVLLEIRNDPAQIDGMVESAIDFIYYYASELSQMFAKRYAEKEALSKWMSRELSKPNQGELFKFVKSNLEQKPYAVQIIVDGLQGHLIEALAGGESKVHFLSKIKEESDQFEKFRPTIDAKFNKMKFKQSFLDYLVSNNNSFTNEAYLPFFKSIYKEYSNGIAKSGVTSTPTTSGRNLPIAATGAPATGPGGTGLPNFVFLDRETENAYYFLGNQSFLLNRYASSNGMRSIFERLPNLLGINCFSVYLKGADINYDGYMNVTVGAKARDFGDRICVSDIKRRAKNQLKFNQDLKELLSLKGTINFENEEMVKRLIAEISDLSNEVMPQYLSYYLPWPDHFAHHMGPFSDEIVSPTGELNRVDYWLSELSKAYKDAGIYDQTLWGMAGDHGLSPIYYTFNPATIFKKMQEEGINLKLTQISAEVELPLIVNFNNRPNMRGHDVIVGATAGGSYVVDLFIDQKENWKKQPLYSDLIHHRFNDSAPIDIIDRVVKELGDSLEYLTVREKESNRENSHMRLISTVEGQRVEAQIIRIKDHIFYMFDYDLVGITKLSHYEPYPSDIDLYDRLLKKCLHEAKMDDVFSWCKEEEWRTLASFTIKPDSVVQLSHLHDTDKSGTLNLFPAPMVAYHTKKSGKHAGENFHDKDAFVGLWGTPVKTAQKLKSEVNGSVPVTLYEYLSGERTVKGEEGWGFNSLMDKLLIK